MTAHTPGPWFVDANGKVWRRDPRDLYENGGGVAGDHPIATAHRGWSRWENVFPVEANARLIAAAPTMHEEMQRFLEVIERAEADSEVWTRLTAGTGIATANAYRAAIAKAKGESA